MAPPMPPVPLPWKLPFQPVTGIHTSILMSESLVGFRVAVTRQKAGRFLNGAPTSPRPPPPAGGVNAPAPTVAADVIVVFGKDREARLSHDTAAAVIGLKRIVANRTLKDVIVLCVLGVIIHSPHSLMGRALGRLSVQGPVKLSTGLRRGWFGKPRRLNWNVRPHLFQVNGGLAVRPRYDRAKWQLDPGDIAVVLVVGLGGNRADCRLVPAHHALQQSGGFVEVEVDRKLSCFDSLSNGELLIVDDGAAGTPSSELLLDPRRKGCNRFYPGPEQIRSGQRGQWCRSLWPRDPTVGAVVDPDAVFIGHLDDRSALIRSFGIDLQLDGSRACLIAGVSARGDKAGEVRQPLRSTDGLDIFVKKRLGRYSGSGDTHGVGIWVRRSTVLQTQIRRNLGRVAAMMAGEAAYAFGSSERPRIDGVYHR